MFGQPSITTHMYNSMQQQQQQFSNQQIPGFSSIVPAAATNNPEIDNSNPKNWVIKPQAFTVPNQAMETPPALNLNSYESWAFLQAPQTPAPVPPPLAAIDELTKNLNNSMALKEKIRNQKKPLERIKATKNDAEARKNALMDL